MQRVKDSAFLRTGRKHVPVVYKEIVSYTFDKRLREW